MLKHILTLIWNKRRQNFLLFLEIFIAFLILFGVFTFVIYNFSTYNSPMGFETENRWVGMLRYEDDVDSANVVRIKETLKRELEAKPEIKSIAYGDHMTIPFSGWTSQTSNEEEGYSVDTRICGGDVSFKETMGLEVIEGRWFNEDDYLSKDRVAVITEKLRKESFGDQPILDSVRNLNGHCKIIGIVKNFKIDGEFEKEYNMTFLHHQPHEKGVMIIELNGEVEPIFEEEVNNTISSITKRNDFIIQHVESERERKSRSTWIPIVAFLSISGFLILNVALGLFGVLWFNINKRRGEIGVRRALGATKNEITTQFISEITTVSLIGILIATFFAVQFPMMKIVDIANQHFYYGMLCAAVLILLLVLICSFYPSRQAARIHPAVALHEE